MKKVFFLSAFVLALTAAGFSQSDYKSAIGIKFSSSYFERVGATYKFFVGEPHGIELGLGVRPNQDFGYLASSYNTTYLTFSAAYQYHFDIPVDGLRWYVGGGALGYNAFSSYDGPNKSDYKGFGLGLFPTGGVDYKFAKIPLNLSADIRPTFIIDGPTYWNSFDANVGVSARYTIGSRK